MDEKCSNEICSLHSCGTEEIISNSDYNNQKFLKSMSLLNLFLEDTQKIRKGTNNEGQADNTLKHDVPEISHFLLCGSCWKSTRLFMSPFILWRLESTYLKLHFMSGRVVWGRTVRNSLCLFLLNENSINLDNKRHHELLSG